MTALITLWTIIKRDGPNSPRAVVKSGAVEIGDQLATPRARVGGAALAEAGRERWACRALVACGGERVMKTAEAPPQKTHSRVE